MQRSVGAAETLKLAKNEYLYLQTPEGLFKLNIQV